MTSSDNAYAPRKLEASEYSCAVKYGQIISIDLLFINNNDEVLVGKRNNNPAKGDLFTLGGRVYKHEDFQNAIERIAKTELYPFDHPNRPTPTIHGIYKHFYDNNFEDNNEYSTEYINFAYVINIDDYYSKDTNEKICKLHIINDDDQHSRFAWIPIQSIHSNTQVHPFVKCYFHPNPWNKIT